ncbi:hypothetical protein RFI_32048 [Reticulomyxa filosa]|uniref:Uncharacterized protein n=1 Tax=Reticulomyxa filosa TaxID=46433 RepID=X6LTV4_RETFI|nr:hypothetical protein RFI_32048 [Reticulomyxa filosa]|eukprot:ETO05343.1 hypothetical protein RFI_32048 [Reticulomyxa filosa]
MFAEEAIEGGVDPATLDLDTMAIGAARQLAITGRLDEMLIAMILGEAEAGADGNEDEYGDQAKEQEDPLESILNDPNLPPWAKEEAFVEQVYMQQQQMQQQKFEIEYGEKSRHSTRESSRGGRGGGRGGHFASGHFGRRKHYRFPPRGKITRFPVTPFQADLTIPKSILASEKRQKIGLQITVFFSIFFLKFLLCPFNLIGFVCSVQYECAKTSEHDTEQDTSRANASFDISIAIEFVANNIEQYAQVMLFFVFQQNILRNMLSFLVTFGHSNLVVEEKKALFPSLLHVIFNWEMFTLDTWELAMKLCRRVVTWVEPSLMSIPALSKIQTVSPSSVVKQLIQLIGVITHRKADAPSKEELASNAVVSQFTQAAMRKASSTVLIGTAGLILPVDEEEDKDQEINESALNEQEEEEEEGARRGEQRFK